MISFDVVLRMSEIRAESELFGQRENKREKTRFGADFRESGRPTFKDTEMNHKAASFSISFRTPDIAGIAVTNLQNDILITTCVVCILRSGPSGYKVPEFAKCWCA
jgi:hypothetical protein